MVKGIKELFSEKILLASLDLFELDLIEDLGGFESFVYRCRGRNGKFIMKITHSIRRTVGMLLGELDFVNHLASNGVKTARAVKSKNRNFVEILEDGRSGYFYAYVFEKLEGKRVDAETWNAEFVFEFGKMLGRSHALSLDFSPVSVENKRKNWFEDELWDLDKMIPDELEDIRVIIAERLEKVKAFPKTDRNYGIIHGDLHQGNFFVDGSRIAPFDYDDCEYNFFANDLAVSLYYFSYMPFFVPENSTRRKAANEFVTQFLKGYRTEFELNDSELEHIDDFVSLRHYLLYALQFQIGGYYTADEKKRTWLNKYEEGIRSRIPILDLAKS